MIHDDVILSRNGRRGATGDHSDGLRRKRTLFRNAYQIEVLTHDEARGRGP